MFSSERARGVAEKMAAGVPVGSIVDPEDSMVLTAQEARGREVYKAVCASCHGGATKNRIVDRVVHAQAFPALRPDGTVIYKVPATENGDPVLAAQPNNEFINIGSALENYLAQLVKFTGFEGTEHDSFTKD